MTMLLSIENVNKAFGRGTIHENCVLRDFNLVLNTGDFVSVIGSNGTGKTTLMNCIAGSYGVDTGEIRLGDMVLNKQPARRRAKYIGRVFQNPSTGTASDLTIAENMAIAWRRGMRSGLGRSVDANLRATFRERLEFLGLGLEDRLDVPVRYLSGGQRQALSLLMATLRQPKLLLLDEHTASLDPNTSLQVMELTDRLVREYRQTTLMITHNMQNAIQYGNRLIMLHEGHVVADVSGAEKEELTVPLLVEMFRRQANGDLGLSDKVVLTA
ncbi:MAG: ATP-binding cassette domain-containing protein [Clostridiaceae bacterium]|nr:ATP-binding cassette domain-containing protein [Clostridiaceae bacterium]